MKNLLKVLLCMIVALPMVAYVAETLVAASQEAPRPAALVLSTSSFVSGAPVQNPDATDAKDGTKRRTLEITPSPERIEPAGEDSRDPEGETNGSPSKTPAKSGSGQAGSHSTQDDRDDHHATSDDDNEPKSDKDDDDDSDQHNETEPPDDESPDGGDDRG